MSETTTIKLLDTLKGRGFPSDYAISKALGRTRSNVSKWRTGRDQMDAEAVAKAAELAGIDPISSLAKIEAERAQSENARNMFEKLHQAAELVELIKRTPALKAALAQDVRDYAQAIENAEERERFMSNPFLACILCYIPAVVRPDICIRQKLRRFPGAANHSQNT